MTTDPDEGRRQLEAMKPEPLKVGDTVRLKAGGRPMVVVDLDIALEECFSMAMCEWMDVDDVKQQDAFPVTSLVRVE